MQPSTLDLAALPHELDDGVGAAARIGLIVLATDQTIEHEWRRIFGQLHGVALYEARIWNDVIITPESLRSMERDIASTTRLIMPVLPLDVVAFGCTSAAIVLGEGTIAERVNEARPGVKVTTPIGAALEALRFMGVERPAVLTPYGPRVNQIVKEYIESCGPIVSRFGTFAEEDDSRAARIAAASVRDAAIALGRDPSVDSVFVSCTSLRVVEVIDEIEAAIGKPVTSSNHAMAWHALRLAGIDTELHGNGRLFAGH